VPPDAHLSCYSSVATNFYPTSVIAFSKNVLNRTEFGSMTNYQRTKHYGPGAKQYLFILVFLTFITLLKYSINDTRFVALDGMCNGKAGFVSSAWNSLLYTVNEYV
jgi:hypothetical protein